jgi:nitrite reductase (NADH) small subunit
MITTATRVQLCVLDDIPTGLGRAFEVGGRSIAVFRGRDGRVFAVDGKCPHKNGPLADGMLIGEQVVCPLHAFRFHGATGECDQPGTCGIEAYPTEVREGTVFVTVPTE